MNRILSVTMILVTAACSSIEADFCEKLDECNALNGQSVDECTENSEKALEDLADSKRSDCEDEYQDCVDKESCEAFGQCVIEDTDSCR